MQSDRARAYVAYICRYPVGSSSITHDREIESDASRFTLVLRPPASRVEGRWNYETTIDSLVGDGWAALRTHLSRLCVKTDRQLELVGQFLECRLLLQIGHAK